ncbi:FMO1 [Symbiodinium natans]|uniref:FMO1 protein n=1 Tax=Symbiodinium natans TaxID=878477 RepID=A0A812J5G5_9DINO|nr:FMO1 [Symbiodinium natans]
MIAAAGRLLRTGFARRSSCREFSQGWKLGRLPSKDEQVLLGAVSYDPAISTIWGRMKIYLNTAGCPFDFVLFTNYERQVAALLAGEVDIAWNGPVAHVLAEQHAGPNGLVSLGMRDVDCDFVSICVARKDANVSSVHDVHDKVVATGASDSPQAHLVPLYWLHEKGVRPSEIRAFDLDLGKHGDTALGEVAAMECLLQHGAQVGLLSKMMWDRGLAGELSIDPKMLETTLEVVPGEGPPLFDHCQFDVLAHNPLWKRESFSNAIFKMDMQNPEHEEVMRLEGIQKKWMPPRHEGYAVVHKAVEAFTGKRHFGTQTGGSWGSRSPRAKKGTFNASRSFSTSAQKPSVGVVGAGVAGLQAIRSLEAKGFAVKVFEQDAGIGGVWRENYVNFGVQVPKQLYEFPDFPFNLPWGTYPTGPETQQYIEDYADHFKLRKSVQTGTRVEAIHPENSGWVFTTKQDGEKKEESFDYCIMATGLYNKASLFIPDLPDKEKFAGKAVHSTYFQDFAMAENKRVVVVGGGKSAVDCATEASKVAAKVTLVSRKPHWPTPRKIANLIPFQYIFLSRLGQALVTGHRGALPGAPGHMSLWHKLSWPLMAVAFSAVEMLFALQFRMSGKTSPLFKCDVVSDFYGHAQVLDYSLRDLVAEGKLEWVIGTPTGFTPDGVTIDGQEVPADLVIYATGFQKDYSLFSEEVRSRLGVEEDGLYLWRHTLAPKVPRLAFVGSELATISNISSYGLQSAWLGKVWSGEIDLPKVEAMEAELEEMKKWKRGWMPATSSRASLVLLHQVHFHDTLLKDMGLRHLRKANFLAEALMPYQPEDYNGIVGA